MSQWLVTHVPSWLLLLLMVLITAGAAVAIQMVVRRRFPNLRGDEHNDVTKFAFGVVGFVFAFFIGFVVSAMWGQISHADSVVRTEGAAPRPAPSGVASELACRWFVSTRGCWASSAQTAGWPGRSPART